MSRLKSATILRWGSTAVTLLILAFVALPARAQSDDHRVADRVGRVEFDFANAPAASVEVDLDEGMLPAITGLGKAAIQGVVEALVESGQGRGDSAAEQSAEHLQAVHDIFETTSNVIREIRVRVYEDLSEKTQYSRASMIEHYQKKLAGTNWDSVARIHEGDSVVVVCVSRSGGAIHGFFVIVSERDDLVMANIVCELTPEKVKQATSQATKIGMKAGLEDLIERAIARVDNRRR